MDSYYKCALILLLSGCVHNIRQPDTLEADTKLLRVVYEAKKYQAQESWDKETGWPSTEDCDGMLWAGLARAAGISSVDLSKGEFESGHIYRRPKRTCWDANNIHDAKSTISRDMVLGYLWGVWKSRNIDALKRLQEYGQDHDWIMGEPYPEAFAEVLMTGNLIGLIGRMSCELYDKCPEYMLIQPIHEKEPKDYVVHLTLLYILLDQDILHRGTDDAQKIIERLYQETPKDALVSYAYHLFEDGDFSDTINLLVTPGYESPGYVRGSDNYHDVHWLFVAKLVLDQLK